MSLLPADRDRHVVPRWRPSIARSSSLEFAPVRASPPTRARDADFEERVSDFVRERNAWTAADLVSAAVPRGIADALVIEAAELLTSSDLQTPALRNVLSGLKAVTSTGAVTEPLHLDQIDLDVKQRVGALRQSLRRHPRNALRWIDLALAHVTLGNSEAGQRAVRTALSIAPTNRYVLRSSSRFFVHKDDAGEALYWLEKSGRLADDPWLLAAHIAVSQIVEGPIRHIRAARQLLTDESIAPISASELSAAVASEELRAGRSRPARSFMVSALRRPTENAVAQAVWSRDHGLAGFEIDEQAAPRAYEAETLVAMQDSNWELAHTSVEAWLGDEPFSARAALHASYIATTGLEDYPKALHYATLGLRTSPTNQMLLNNAAFALANLDRTAEAFGLLDIARSSEPRMASMLQATRGLAHFRQGEIALGRELYRQATEQFRQDGSTELAALCQVMWAREEIRAGTNVGDGIFVEAADVVRHGKSRDARVWMERIRKQLRSAK